MHKVALGCASFRPFVRCSRDVSLTVTFFFTEVKALRFNGNELLQIEYLRGVLIKTSMDENP